VLGVILLDVGVQAAHISNQTLVFSLRPEARSRLNTVYMTGYFTGGSIGSVVGGLAWMHFGWLGVCAVGGALVALALLVHRSYER
jgi:predicted MFS family arabinose efflux permease